MRARLRELLARSTPGPWSWFGNAKFNDVYLATVNRGRQFVMGFKRWGMRGAQPTFQVNHLMVDGSTLVIREVPYRGDIAGFDHPDAMLIVAAVNALPALLDAAEAAEVLANEIDEGSQDPMRRHRQPESLPKAVAAVRRALTDLDGAL